MTNLQKRRIFKMARKSQKLAEEQPINASMDANIGTTNEILQTMLATIQKLQSRIDDLESNKQIEKNLQPQPIPKSKVKVAKEVEYDDEIDKIEINPDSYIKVISLTPYPLTLSTMGRGRGRLFDFKEFGVVKRIRYADLVDIIENHQNFVNNLYFMVMDKRVIRRHGLDELYSKALSKEQIESIILGNSVSDAYSLFLSADKTQQEFIVDMLLEKMVHAPDSVDLNLVEKVSRASGAKLIEKAEQSRSLIETLKSELE
jgi:hypothetical protein